MQMVSVVVPVYNNAPSLALLHRRLADVLRTVASEYELLFVDDGSADDSFAVLQSLAAQDARVKALRFVRNFGSNTAILAGLTHARGDCVVVVSADLQDPPELIPEMIRRWQQGVKVVLAARAARRDPFLTRLFADAFNWLFRRLVFPNFPRQGFDFFLADRQVVRVLAQSAERNTYLMGLLLWSGFKFETVVYAREERPFGKSQWNLGKKIKYFIDAFVGFSYFPLRLASLGGISFAILGFLYALFVLALRAAQGFPVEGWASLMIVLLIVSGIQMTMLGILGEYLWRTLDETRRRPLFLIAETIRVDLGSAHMIE
ncbi:MAG: glycosyltransferase [Chloroflexi bacterium]|nr:glycosyltransferase [Chloroflexota bacterium]